MVHFIPGLTSIFIVLGMAKYDSEFETEEKKFQTMDNKNSFACLALHCTCIRIKITQALTF